jgi:Uma2 family endonuclease
MATVTASAPPLVNGDRLSRDEFLRRWSEHPETKRAELIGGIVYLASPVTLEHGDSEGDLGLLLGTYAAHTPGVKHAHNTTILMDEDAPQPDVHLRILPEYGGVTRKKGKSLWGSPELTSEVCLTSAVYDLHQKLELYEEAGVQEYLAVLIYEREIRWHTLTKKGYQAMAPASDNLWKSKIFPGLWLDGQALLAHDSGKILATLQKGLQSLEHADFVKKLAKKKGK